MEKYNLLAQNIPGHQVAKPILECAGGFQPWMVGERELMCPDLFFSLLHSHPYSSHLTRCFSFIIAVIELKAEDRSKFLDGLISLLS